MEKINQFNNLKTTGMKNSIKLVLTVISLNFVFQSFGQYAPIPIEYKIEHSSLIIEGKVVARQSYLGTDNQIYTENVVKVDKVLKGTVAEPEISIITMGGQIDGRISTWSHLLALNTNEYGAFFLKPTERPVRANSSLKAFDVFSGAQGFYHYQKKGIGYSATTVLDSHETVSSFYSKLGIYEEERNKAFTLFDKVNPDSCLVYRIEPVTGSSLTANTMVYFNILVKVKTGEYRLNQTELYLKYSTEWFYENMVDDGNLTFSQGEFDQTDYGLTIEDYNSSTLHINLQALSTNYLDLKTVNDSFKLVATVGVTLKSFSDDPPLEEDFSVADIANNYRTEEGYLKDFNCVSMEVGANCGMEITMMTPLAAAGVGLQSENGITGVVELEGDNFLDDDAVFGDCPKPEKHRVKFRTIDGNWIAPLEGDYLEYTNTKIRVKVPTVGYKDNSDDMYSGDEINDGVACTGEVRVCKDRFFKCWCFVTSDDDLYVPFAARNTFKTNDDGCRESVKYILQDLDDAGGYTWRFDATFTAVAGAVDAFKRALSTWRCTTKVNFKVDEVNPPAAGDGLCTAKMASLPVGTRGATNFLSFGSCFGTDINYPIRIEITFNSTMNWHTGTDMPDLNWNNTGAGTLEGDMESTALHELGHAHLLLHTCNAPNVMVRPGPNDYRRMLTSDDENGGNHLSMLGNNTNGCQGNMDLILTGCDITPVVEIEGKIISVNIYPNPVESTVFIEFSSVIKGHMPTIELFDLYGRRLESKLLNNHETSVHFNMNQYSSGIYYIRFKNEENLDFIIGKVSKTR
ncbi:MAG: zinc-dependent metalloprotease [Bacteroidetes bacterium]|nr:zinc-dependent metalloprotease [Bacteroidota bacterium]